MLYKEEICIHTHSTLIQASNYVQTLVTVHVGGVMVQPGDLLHGDRNGVTTIPQAIASAVAQACAEFMAAEAVVLDYVRGGKVDVKGFAAAHKECRARIEAMIHRFAKR
jgi:4-hydroxy-4-methyl-2-oxoglutarate aldolase